MTTSTSSDPAADANAEPGMGPDSELDPVPPPPLCRQVERSEAREHDGDDSVGTVDDSITLDETDRHRRRMAMTSDGGIGFVLSLDAAVLLRDGDRLVLDDGRCIVVRAAPEALYEVRGRDAHHLLRLAWHMGNRHLPAQLMDDHLRIRRDAVIGGMLRGLGADVRELEAGFDPEGGAYGDAGGSARQARSHAHDHHPHERHAPDRQAGDLQAHDHHHGQE